MSESSTKDLFDDIYMCYHKVANKKGMLQRHYKEFICDSQSLHHLTLDNIYESLKYLNGKNIVLIGDSTMFEQYSALVCILGSGNFSSLERSNYLNLIDHYKSVGKNIPKGINSGVNITFHRAARQFKDHGNSKKHLTNYLGTLMKHDYIVINHGIHHNPAKENINSTDSLYYLAKEVVDTTQEYYTKLNGSIPSVFWRETGPQGYPQPNSINGWFVKDCLWWCKCVSLTEEMKAGILPNSSTRSVMANYRNEVVLPLFEKSSIIKVLRVYKALAEQQDFLVYKLSYGDCSHLNVEANIYLNLVFLSSLSSS